MKTLLTFQVDHVYKITNVSVKEKKAAQQHFSWVTTKWEITFSKFSSVVEHFPSEFLLRKFNSKILHSGGRSPKRTILPLTQI